MALVFCPTSLKFSLRTFGPDARGLSNPWVLVTKEQHPVLQLPFVPCWDTLTLKASIAVGHTRHICGWVTGIKGDERELCPLITRSSPQWGEKDKFAIGRTQEQAVEVSILANDCPRDPCSVEAALQS